MSVGEVSVQKHYDQHGLIDRIATALKDAGKPLDRLTVEDLAPIDQFHSGGLGTTKTLAARADLHPGQRVLDVGSGIGGPARWLAHTYGCHVAGVDLSPIHCEVATQLSQWVGMQKLNSFRPGSALALPFADASFDRVWTQNVQMNIADKAGFYREIARVLVPGGKFAFSDVVQGPGGPAIYPVVWAMDASISFLQSPESLRQILVGLGLQQLYWEDATAHYVMSRSKQLAPPADDPRAKLSIEIVVGERATERLRNGGRNAEERRILLVQAVWEKPQ